MSERFEVDGVFLHVEVEGAGPPLVLLHGFTGSSATMAETARRLGAGRRTIRIDLLGHGRSDAPAEAAPYAMARCTEQVAGVIDRFAGGTADVLGYSMGGRVALALAAWQPERVRSTILIGARAGFAAPEERRLRRKADDALADSIERDGLEAFVDRWMALPLFASQARLGPEYLETARRQRLGNRPHGLAASLRGLGAGAQPPLHEALAGIDAPTLVVVGQHDERFRAVARELADAIPAARLATVPDAGHAAHVEQPEAFARLARAFLDADGAAAR